MTKTTPENDGLELKLITEKADTGITVILGGYFVKLGHEDHDN